MLQVIWHPKAKDEISSFPDDVKGKLGYLIFRLQLGENLTLPHSRSMKTLGPGVKELRVKGADGIYRSFYLKVDRNRIAIFHAFKKKTQKTPQKELSVGEKNMKEVLKWLEEK